MLSFACENSVFMDCEIVKEFMSTDFEFACEKLEFACENVMFEGVHPSSGMWVSRGMVVRVLDCRCDPNAA